MNNSGKTLMIFLVVIAMLLIALTAIAVFFFLKEVDLRKAAEYNLEQMQVVEAKLQNELKETKDQLVLLEEKNKEAENKVESMMEEVELEQGLREELKKENRQLQDSLTKESEDKEQLRAQMAKDLSEAEKKIAAMQEELNVVISEKQKLEETYQDTLSKYQALQGPSGLTDPVSQTPEEQNPLPDQPPAVEPQAENKEVDLDKIVVNAPPETLGKVISVDTETEFIIVNIGEKDGVRKNTLLSLYRGDKLLGDVKVTRVLPEMSAADFVPPLSSQAVQKDDRVVIKK